MACTVELASVRKVLEIAMVLGIALSVSSTVWKMYEYCGGSIWLIRGGRSP